MPHPLRVLCERVVGDEGGGSKTVGFFDDGQSRSGAGADGINQLRIRHQFVPRMGVLLSSLRFFERQGVGDGKSPALSFQSAERRGRGTPCPEEQSPGSCIRREAL